MRYLAWACLVGAGLVAGAGAAGARTWQELSTRTLDVSEVRLVRIENARGAVSLLRSSDHRLHLRALKITRASDSKWADRLSKETEVVVEPRAGELAIRVRYPQRRTVNLHFWDLFSDFELPRVEVRLALEVPAGLAVAVKSARADVSSNGIDEGQTFETASGDVSVSDGGIVSVSTSSGDVRLESVRSGRVRTASGDLVIEGVRGSLSVSTASGDVQVRDASDSLAVASTSGDIRIDAAPAGVTARSTSGSIEVKRASGRVKAETESGDVELDLAPPLHRVEVRAASGSITTRLGGALACRLDIQTANGEIQLDMPLDLTNATRHHVTGIVRGGTTPIVLRTASGDIKVTEAKP